MKRTFYYDPGTGGTGGFSLSDVVGAGDDKGGITGGDGTLVPPVVTDQVVPPVVPLATVEGVNADGTLQDGYQKDEATGVVSKVPDAPALQQGENADGTLQEGYIKGTDGKVTIDPNYEVVQEGDFFEAVEKLTGIKVEVEYPEGVSADTPEGVALREQKLLEMGAEGFERTIQEKDPRAYAFFLHRLAGKPEEDFFGTKTGYTLPEKTVLETSADAQAAVYKYDLISKGIDADDAEAMVSAAIKNNKLLDKATAAYGTIEAAQVKQLADLQAAAAKAEEQERTAITTMAGTIKKAIDKDLSFVVPETGKGEFEQFVKQNVRYEDGKFYIVQEMSTDSIKTQLEALYFQHKKGDLSKIIKKTAETQTAQRLSLRHKQSQAAPNGGQGLGSSTKAGLTLSQVIGM